MKRLVFGMTLALLFGGVAAPAAHAGPIFVGSWNVNDGVYWGTNPLAYSGIGAAELLFGPGTYVISTVDANPANIDHQAWYNIIGVGSAIFAEDYFRGIEGITHYQDVYVFDPNIDTVSTYVSDFGDDFTINYAFRVDGTAAVPEPASMTMLGIGAVSLVGYGLRRRRQAKAAV